MKENGKEKEVGNVSEFLLWVKDMHDGEDYRSVGGAPSMPHERLYYRGHADSTRDLEPSLFRKENFHVDERKILRKACLMLWNEVSNFSTNLEKLIYFQHYGLCTRLLDVTYNPLIALYMACCERQESNDGYGLVFAGFKDDRQILKVSEISADFLFNTQDYCLEHYLDEKGDKLAHEPLDGFSLPTFVLPPLNNPRIEAQDGAFIMLPVVDRDGDYINRGMNLNDSEFFDERRAKIPNKFKVEIIKELSELGINRGSIYRDTTNRIKALIENSQMKNGTIIDI